MTKTHDNLYATPQVVKAFAFDDNVARVFADMIARSVPGYGMTLDMIAVIARQYGKPGTCAYDLGCSLGAATLSLRHHVPAGFERVVAVDNSPAMVVRCREIMAADRASVPVDVIEADICDVPIHNASLVVMNFTLQFVAKEKRLALLQSIARGLQPGGALILSEKIHFSDAREEETLRELHHGFKQQQGYSQLEIAQKREALDNVLVPEAIDPHRARLAEAGFSASVVWFQCFNFVSLLAVK